MNRAELGNKFKNSPDIYFVLREIRTPYTEVSGSRAVQSLRCRPVDHVWLLGDLESKGKQSCGAREKRWAAADCLMPSRRAGDVEDAS